MTRWQLLNSAWHVDATGRWTVSRLEQSQLKNAKCILQLLKCKIRDGDAKCEMAASRRSAGVKLITLQPEVARFPLRPCG